MLQFRQGDVFIEQITSLPKNLKKQDNIKLIILAKGEATGHHHSIDVTEATESFVDKAGVLYLRLNEETSLTHQEHAPIMLPRGIYIVTTQREYYPTEIRNVLD